MKYKGAYVGQLIVSILITSLLVSLFLKTNSKIVFIPFLICSSVLVLRNIFLLLEKPKYVQLLNFLFMGSFILFCFGFLFYWCYFNYLYSQYMLILFSIPFWYVSIRVFNRHILKGKLIHISVKSNYKFNLKKIIGVLLVVACLASGIIMCVFGISGTYRLNEKTKDYIITQGYFSNYNIYQSDKDGTTYQLTYVYQVAEQEYTITTDYGTQFIPEHNSVREIKYNQFNPYEAILVGAKNQNSLIYMGSFFLMVSIIFILGALSRFGYLDKFKIDILGVSIGLVFFIVGVGIILFQTGQTMNLFETYNSLGLWVLIPLMFIGVGLFQLVKSLGFKQKNRGISK